MSRTVHTAARIITCDPSRRGALGVVENAALATEHGRIAWIGPRDEAPSGGRLVDHGDHVLTPGLVDAHTHACWTGSRHAEYAVRMAGGDYEAIAKAGGGILSSYRSVAAATHDVLREELAARLRRMAMLGVTTVEVKSGYGLEPDGERKQLEVIADLRRDASLPRIVPTFLALHSLPPSARDSEAARRAFVDHVARVLVPEVAARELALFVDAYIDREAFQLDEARAVFEAARDVGLGIRAHVGQFADIGGAELAAELGAASVDHMEHVNEAALCALRASGTRPILLPVASFTLAQTPPPVAAMRDAGLELVVASDANPGTAPTESLPLALAFAVRSYGLTPDEAILGATRHAAETLRHAHARLTTGAQGMLAVGAPADFVVWDFPHEHCIVQPWGVARTLLVCRDGEPIASAVSRAP